MSRYGCQGFGKRHEHKLTVFVLIFAIVMSVIQVAVASCIGAGSGALADPIFVYGTAGPLMHRVNPTLTNIFPQSDQNLYTASEPISVILNYKPRFYGRVGQGFGPGLVTNLIIFC